MIYELRFYSVTHGRMPDVHSRFTDNLPALFAKHGIQCVGGWTSVTGPNTPRFVYLMPYRDFAHRESAWASFYADPDWARIRAETNAGHEMVERSDLFFLKPNAAWQADASASALSAGGIHEMVLQQIAPGQNAATNEFLAQTYLPLLRDCGARTLGVFDMASGAGMPQLVMFHAWPDAAAWHRGRAALEQAPTLLQAFKAQRQKLGYPYFGRSEVNLLEPVSGTPVHPTLGREA